MPIYKKYRYLSYKIFIILNQCCFFFLHARKLKCPPYLPSIKTLSNDDSFANAIDDEHLLFYVSFI